MTRNYCSLWDINYMAKGLSLYASLHRHAQPFHLYILALDDETRGLLETLSLPYATIIPLAVLESRLNLAPVRATRSWMEYCWTLASQLMEYVMRAEHMGAEDLLTYLDSDLYFYSPPEPIYDELGAGSIAIVPHRFHAGNKRLEANGVYNVGWLTIRGSIAGWACLLDWAAKCREWCYHRNEDGKFGDQGYLDQWPERYGDACRVIQNIGAGCAPWNVILYAVRMRGETVCLSADGAVAGWLAGRAGVLDQPQDAPLIFHHFHEFTHDPFGNTTRLTRHPLRPYHKRLIYAPYSDAIKTACARISAAKTALAEQQEQIKQQGERA